MDLSFLPPTRTSRQASGRPRHNPDRQSRYGDPERNQIIDNGEVPGITGGALDANEKAPGPIMLQGDHGRVQFRKVRITPLI